MYFFVISGYLITKIITVQMSKGTFSFIDFYRRRIRRLFPSLVLVLAIFIVLGWATLFTTEFGFLGKHALGAAAFIENFLYWRESGYFDASSELKPFLNLWSVSVEEQFYLLWPPLLLLSIKKSFSSRSFIFSLTLISFILNLIISPRFPAISYFAPFTRLWELGLGCVIAFAPERTWFDSCPKIWLHVFSVIGLFLILFAAAFLNQDMLYPYYWGLFPTIGAALLLYTRKSFINSRLLSAKFLVGIGLISYPLYLWHWPLFSFASIYNPAGVPLYLKFALIIVSLILALFSYFFVEKHLRFGSHSSLKSIVLVGMMAGIGIVGYMIMKGKIKVYYKNNLVIAQDWHSTRGLQTFKFKGKHFAIKVSRTNKSVLFLGDSNMEQYAARINQLIEQSPTKTKTAIFATSGGMPPIYGVLEDKHPYQKGFMEAVSAYLEGHPEIDTVVIACSWGALLSKTHYYKDNEGKRYNLCTKEGYSLAIAALENMIIDLRKGGKKVWIVQNIPAGPELNTALSPRRYNFFYDIFLLRSDLSSGGYHREESVKRRYLLRAKFESKYQEINRTLQDLAKKTGTYIVNPLDYLCDETYCPTHSPDGKLIYKDASHLAGSYTQNYIQYLDQAIIV